MTYYGRWTYKYEEAARRGAAGVLIVHETDPASYGWNTVKNSNTNTMFDIVRQNPAAEHPLVRKLDPALARRADLRGLRPQFRPGQGRGPPAQLPADPAQGDTRRRKARRRSRRSTRTMSSATFPARSTPTRR